MRSHWISIVSVLLFLAAWEGVARTGWVSQTLFPSPVRVVRAGIEAPGLMKEKNGRSDER